MDALPWWEYQLLLEGLFEEFSDDDEGGTDAGPEDLGMTMRTA